MFTLFICGFAIGVATLTLAILLEGRIRRAVTERRRLARLRIETQTEQRLLRAGWSPPWEGPALADVQTDVFSEPLPYVRNRIGFI